MTSIFSSVPTANGFSWTIGSKLGYILNDAEAKYGQRDMSYTILGVELTINPVPQIWYPGNNKRVLIQITSNCEFNIDEAVFQVAHEAIHCLCPTGSNNANVLEEGVATYFSIEYCKNNGHGSPYPQQTKYQDALNLYNQLIVIDPDIIKKARQVEPTISRISKNLLMSFNPGISSNLADELVKPF